MSEFFKDGEEGLGVAMTVYRPGVKFAANSCIAIDPVRESGNGKIIHGTTARLFWKNGDTAFDFDWGISGTAVKDTPAGNLMAHTIFSHLNGRQYRHNEGNHSSQGMVALLQRLIRQRGSDRLMHYRDSVPVDEPSWAELKMECEEQVQSFRIQIERIGFQLNVNRRGR